MLTINNGQHPHKNFRPKGKHSSLSRSFISNSQNSSFVGNQLFEQYSFNKGEEIHKTSSDMQTYDPIMPEMEQPESHRNSQLIQKYSSIYSKLRQLEMNDVIQLFLEEIDENEKCRQMLVQQQLQAKGLKQQISQLKCSLQQKREAIRKLCQTQSNNLNIIECLQQNNNVTMDWDSHFVVKYRQLEACMNQYISNTNQAQEEIMRSYRLLKKQSQQLLQLTHKLQSENCERGRYIQIITIDHTKCLKELHHFQQRQRDTVRKLQNLQAENISLRKQVEDLQVSVRANQHFEIELAKENKELSSQLDFIRQKINDNSSLSRDIFQKMQMDLAQKLTKQKQQLQMKLENAHLNHEEVLQENSQLAKNYQKLLEQLKQKEVKIYQLQRQIRNARQLQQNSTFKNKSNGSMQQPSKSSLQNYKHVYHHETFF